jgi:hypothetical protein
VKVFIGGFPGPRSKKTRKVNVRIDKEDTWSLDHTLAYIIHPALIQLKATKHGSPMTDDEDVPDHLKATAPAVDEENKDSGTYEGSAAETNIFVRWDWIMDEMIWAFAQILDDNAEDKFHTGEMDMIWIPMDKDHKELGAGIRLDEKGDKYPEAEFWRMADGPNHSHKTDREGLEAHSKRVANGFRLFGKYYQALWD